MNKLQLSVILSYADKLTAPLKAASKSSAGLGLAIKEARSELKSLEQQQGSISKLKDLARITAATKNEMAAARLRTAELAKEIKSTSSPSAKLTKDFSAARDSVRQLQQRERDLTLQQQKLRDSLKAAGIDTKHLSSEQTRLRNAARSANDALLSQQVRLSELAERQRKLNAVSDRYNKSKELQGKLAGTGVGMMATGVAAGATVVKPIIEYAKAEDSATALKVSMMGSDGSVRKEFSEINKLAIQLGNKLPGTTSDFQDMMSTLIQQGMSAKAIVGGLGVATAYLGVQMRMPYDQAALFAAKLQDATSTTEKDMMGLMDVIQRSFYLGVDSGNMLQAFGKLSPALSVLRKKGVEATKALAPLVIMADQAGMAGEASGNAYRKVFQMSMNRKKVNAANSGALKGTGIKLEFTDGKGEFAGIDKLMAELAKMKRLNTEKRLQALKDIYGDDAETLQVLNLLIEKGADGYADVQKKLAAQANIQQRVNAQLGTLKNLWDAATGTFTNALVKFGESVAPETKAITEWIGALSERLGAWSERHPVLSAAIMKTVAAIAAASVAIGALSLGIAALLGPIALNRMILSSLGIRIFPMLSAAAGFLSSAIGGVTSGIIRMGVAAMTNPIGIVIAAIVAGALLIYKYWSPIKAFMSGVFDGFSSAIGPIKQLFEPLSPLFDGIGRAVKWVFSLFGDLLTPVKSTAQELSSAAASGKVFGEAIAGGINFALTPLYKLIDGIKWVIDNVSKIDFNRKIEVPKNFTPGQATPWSQPTKTPGFAGMYDKGGYIPSGKFGVAGENGPEVVGGPAYVLSRAKTKAIAAMIAGAASLPVAAYQDHSGGAQDSAKAVSDRVLPAKLSPISNVSRVITERVQPAKLPSVSNATRVINEKVLAAQPADYGDEQAKPSVKARSVIRQSNGNTQITIPLQVSFNHEKNIDEAGILKKIRDTVRSEIERAASASKARERAKLYDRE